MPFESTDVHLKRATDTTFEVTRDIVYKGKNEIFVVPAGFCTDFASVPRIAVWLIPKFGKWTLAAILHDWFCAVAIAAGIISPRDADAIFRRVSREYGVPPLLRSLMWCGVRWGAAANPIRRHEWWRDLPRVAPLTLLALPIVGPPALLIAVGLALYVLAETAVTLVIPSERPTTGAEAGLTT